MSSKSPSAIGLSMPAGLAGAERTSPSVQQEVLQLFDECAPKLRRYVRSFGLGPDVTEDVVQEVFVSLFRHLRLGRSRRNLRAWVFQVGHNLALKQREKTTRRLRVEGAWDVVVAETFIDAAANPEQRLADAQRTERLRSVVRALPERDRQCLYLRAEGLRYREIARTLGISLGAVAKSLTRAISRLTVVDE